MITLTPLQLDALAEGFNIALGHAAATFSELVREPVRITVPSIELIWPSAMRDRINTLYDNKFDSQLCGVRQSFSSQGTLRADTMLVFTESGSLDIIRQMLGVESSIAHFTELEQDALAEIGNIITNSCMSSFADLFEVSLMGTLPKVMLNDAELFAPERFGQDIILLAQIGLSLTSRNTTGLVLFFMDGPTIQNFVDRVEQAFNLTH